MTNKHCDSVSIEEAYRIMDALSINKKTFCELAGCHYTRFTVWDKKGRLPEYRLSQIKLALHKAFKDDYDRKCKVLEGM